MTMACYRAWCCFGMGTGVAAGDSNKDGKGAFSKLRPRLCVEEALRGGVCGLFRCHYLGYGKKVIMATKQGEGTI